MFFCSQFSTVPICTYIDIYIVQFHFKMFIGIVYKNSFVIYHGTPCIYIYIYTVCAINIFKKLINQQAIYVCLYFFLILYVMYCYCYVLLLLCIVIVMYCYCYVLLLLCIVIVMYCYCYVYSVFILPPGTLRLS